MSLKQDLWSKSNWHYAAAIPILGKVYWIDKNIFQLCKRYAKSGTFVCFAKNTCHWCLVLLHVPKCFVPVQIFWANPKIWLHLVPLQNLLCRHKNQFCWMQIIFLSGTKCLWLPQYVNTFLVWHKKFGPSQNILGPVKGQGKNLLYNFWNYLKEFKGFTCYFWWVLRIFSTVKPKSDN